MRSASRAQNWRAMDGTFAYPSRSARNCTRRVLRSRPEEDSARLAVAQQTRGVVAEQVDVRVAVDIGEGGPCPDTNASGNGGWVSTVRV